jgi:glycerate kinase
MLFIGGLIAPALVNAANDYAKSIGGETIATAGIGWMSTLGAEMFAQSTDDFNAFKSVFGRGVQWTPFSL